MSPLRALGGRVPFASPLEPRSPQARRHTPTATPFCETFPNDGDFTVTAEDLTWLVDSGTIASGRCRKTVFYALARAEHDMTSQDQFVQCDWVTTDVTNNDLWLLARVTTTPATFIWDAIGLFIFRSGADCFVSIFDWAASSDVGGTVTLSNTSPVATWRLEVEGTTARGYRDGVLVVSQDVSAVSPYPSGTRAAFYLENDTEIDNFCFGDL